MFFYLCLVESVLFIAWGIYHLVPKQRFLTSTHRSGLKLHATITVRKKRFGALLLAFGVTTLVAALCLFR